MKRTIIAGMLASFFGILAVGGAGIWLVTTVRSGVQWEVTGAAVENASFSGATVRISGELQSQVPVAVTLSDLELAFVVGEDTLPATIDNGIGETLSDNHPIPLDLTVEVPARLALSMVGGALTGAELRAIGSARVTVAGIPIPVPIDEPVTLGR